MKVALVTNPRGDYRFRSRAEACLASGADTPALLQRELRAEYPNVSVSDGIVEQATRRWYAYREGHWVPTEEFSPSERA